MDIEYKKRKQLKRYASRKRRPIQCLVENTFKNLSSGKEHNERISDLTDV